MQGFEREDVLIKQLRNEINAWAIYIAAKSLLKKAFKETFIDKTHSKQFLTKIIFNNKVIKVKSSYLVSFYKVCPHGYL